MSARPKTRVLLVDDHPVFRRRLRLWIESWDDVEVVGEAEDGENAVAETLRLQPDLVVMDVQMPSEDGVSACRRIKDLRRDAKVILFSAFADELTSPPAGLADALLRKERLFEELPALVTRCLSRERE